MISLVQKASATGSTTGNSLTTTATFASGTLAGSLCIIIRLLWYSNWMPSGGSSTYTVDGTTIAGPGSLNLGAGFGEYIFTNLPGTNLNYTLLGIQAGYIDRTDKTGFPPYTPTGTRVISDDTEFHASTSQTRSQMLLTYEFADLGSVETPSSSGSTASRSGSGTANDPSLTNLTPTSFDHWGTPTANGDLVFAVVTNTSSLPTAGAGFTMLDSGACPSPFGSYYWGVEYMIQDARASVTPSFSATGTASPGWQMGAMLFRGTRAGRSNSVSSVFGSIKV